MNDDLAAYEADAQLSPAEATNILASITNTAFELRAAQADVKSCEEHLKAAQDRVKALSEITLPALMDEAKQNKLETLDGYEVSRGETVRASISETNMPAAVLRLRELQQDAILKREVKLAFGKGEDQSAAEAVDALREHGFTPLDRYSVHHMTLASVVKELMGEGRLTPDDLELLGVFCQPWVKVKEITKATGKRR